MTRHVGAASLIERAAEIYGFDAQLRSPLAPAAGAQAETPLRAMPAQRPARARTWVGEVPVDRAMLAANGFICPESPTGALAEQFRVVKRSLLRAMATRPDVPRSVLIGSAQPGDGKTFCALNLALSLAGEKDLEVLLIDGDVLKPELAGLLGIVPEPGLIDAIAEERTDVRDLVVVTDIPGLSFLPAGREAVNVTELLASDRTRAVVARLLEGQPNRILLFDSPPVLAASPAAVLAAHAGHAVLVVRADTTTEPDLRQAAGLLSACPNLATLLNGAVLDGGGSGLGCYNGAQS